MLRTLIDKSTAGICALKKNRKVNPSPVNGTVKVNLGCGLLVAAGWVNIDGSLNALVAALPPLFKKTAYFLSGAKHYYSYEQYRNILDDNKFIHHNLEYGIPLTDSCADFAYSSHFLEHLPKNVGQFFIREIFRILKPGGRVRIVVPDLEYALGLYQKGLKNKMLDDFFFVDQRGSCFARHKYMYDFELLGKLLESTGFKDISKCEFKKGQTPDIAELDNQPEISLYMEAIKPKQASNTAQQRCTETFAIPTLPQYRENGAARSFDMTPIKTESLAMHVFKMMGMSRIAWSLRRLYVPVDRRALVLEVGAGGNPYPRANVLLDAYETTVERIEQDLVKDRPFVIGLAERLPFKTKSFDFIISSHVLEHSSDPDSFLKELMRVGKSGYIETPDAFWERINPFTFHRLEITHIDSKIRIYKKPSWRHGEEIVDLFEKQLKNRNLLKYLSKHPEPVYTRFYWVNDIDYEILNPEVRADWPVPNKTNTAPSCIELRMHIRLFVRNLARRLFSQRSRNKKINLMDLLICPTCGYETLTLNGKTSIRCNKCGAAYKLKNGVPIMYPQTGPESKKA